MFGEYHETKKPLDTQVIIWVNTISISYQYYLCRKDLGFHILQWYKRQANIFRYPYLICVQKIVKKKFMSYIQLVFYILKKQKLGKT